MRTLNSTYTHALPGSYSTLYFGDGLNFSLTTSDTLVSLRSGATNVVRLTIVTSGANQVFRLINSAGTTLATGTTALVASTWYYVEIGVVVSATVGTVELRLNGLATAECSATGVNTGSSNIDTIAISSANGSSVYSDDMYAVDTTGSSPTNTFLGEVRIETLFPNANGTSTAWTGVYTDVDDTTTVDDDTTYISSSTPGDRETYALTDLVTTTGTVFAVQTSLIARKDDAGARTIAPVIRTGGVDYDGTTTAGLGSTYVGYRQIYDRLDPAGAAWSIATVNAMEAGVKEVT